jgi:hypothetical protein
VKPELFHATNDIGSARVRLRVVERNLEEKISFRNIFYPEVKADFAARGGRNLPALWDGEQLIEGEEAVLAAIESLL